jgi:hypothetical protein
MKKGRRTPTEHCLLNIDLGKEKAARISFVLLP